MFSQIKDGKHIEQNFHFVAKVMPRGGTEGAGGVKNFSVGICDGAPSTAHSSISLYLIGFFLLSDIIAPLIDIPMSHNAQSAHACWCN